jgi:RNA polymerase sigma factor (TIGR02999 family)
MSEVTQILAAIEQGDSQAAEQLLPLVYKELRQLAERKLAREKPGQTLQATALVHEAYLRLVSPAEDGEKNAAPHWRSQGHFFAAAAEAMRRILIDRTRRKRRLRHGGGQCRLDLDKLDLAHDKPPQDLLALNEALEQLEAEDTMAANVVKLRYFAGLTIKQTALALNISVRTADRHWAYAKAWLFQRLNAG